MPSDRPRRILIHPGFHKTGTSSAQHLFWLNRHTLSPYLSLLMLRHLKRVARICLTYSTTQNPLVLADLVEAMDEALALHLPDTGADILISCEGLSGHLPGWPGVDDYAAATLTTTFLTGYLAERFPEAEQSVIFTTRDADAWLNSAWRHHLLGQRLTLDWPGYQAAYRGAADLAQVALAVSEAIDPIPVYTLPLEEAQNHPFGPGGALLELADLPPDVWAQMRPVGRGNRGPDDALAQEYLALNRSTLADDVVRIKKSTLNDGAEIGGWERL